MTKSYLTSQIEEVTGATPFTSVVGIPVYTADEYNKAMAERRMEKAVAEANGKKVSSSKIKLNKNGTVAATKVRPMLMNDEMFYSNRIRFVDSEIDGVKKRRLELVDDYHACKDQASGNVYTNNILVKVIEHTKKGKEDIYTLVEQKHIGVQEFINEFKELLSVDDMQTIVGNLVVPEVTQAKKSKLDF